MARFLIDEDCPRSLAVALRAAGHDAVDVQDIGLRGAKDEAVLARARMESRALITSDGGFGNILRYPPINHAGVVLARLPDTMAARTRVAEILRAVAALGDQVVSGCLVVVEPGRIRLRRA